MYIKLHKLKTTVTAQISILEHGELNLNSCKIKQKLDFNYTFPINLSPNGNQFGVKRNYMTSLN